MLDTVRGLILIFFVVGLVTLNGCATNSQKDCPSVDQERVSICRAEQRCRQEKTTYGLGMGVGKETDSGIMGARTMATTNNYNDCIERDLQAQGAENQVVD